jgi:3-phenylpropionate/trans-cinnamate dioxygenase ferredoxin component
VSGSAAPPRRVPLAASDLPAEGEARGVEIAPGRRLLVARVGGRLHALDDVCNHAGCLLSQGRIEDGKVVCPCHYMTFDLRDGRLLVTPRLADDQPSYPVVEEDGGVVVVLAD